MKILTVVTARGGSKRLPRKNIKILGDKPLICWTIDSAKNIPEICDILVTTDDEEIAEVSTNFGALVPWLRPGYLSGDDARSVDVVIHALDWYEKNYGVVDGVLLLQPTSPFRKKETIEKAISLYLSKGRQTLLTLSPIREHPILSFYVTDNRLQSVIPMGDNNLRFQDLPPAYILNGLIYLIEPSRLRYLRSFNDPGAYPLIIDSSSECLDIDDEWDWFLAGCIESKLRL